MNFSITFKNSKNQSFNLRFKTYDTDISKRWYKALVEQVYKNNKVREPDRFYGFPAELWNEEKIVSELNKCIAAINNYKKAINHTAYVGMPQEQLNYLHHYFETLRGGILTPGDFWLRADQEVRNALERYNIIIHRAEDFYHNQQSNKISPRIVCTFFNKKRYSLLDEDYNHFTMLRTFGEVYINYCEVGKPLYDVYRDGDDIVGEDNIRPLRYYSADFRVHFHEKSKKDVDEFLIGMDRWWNDNHEYLAATGFHKNDPKNAIGNIPVAKLDTDLSNSEIVNKLCEFNIINSVSISDA
jgi:hypothetical protein